MHFPKRLFPVLLLSLFSLLALRGDIVSWRNGGNGIFSNVSAPTQWDDPSNLLWKIDTPMWGNACPVLIGDKLVYTSEPAQLICVDARNGNLLWEVSNGYEDVAELSPEQRQRIDQAKRHKASLEKRLAPLRSQEYKLNRRFQRDKENDALRQELRTLRREIAAHRESLDPILERFEKPKAHDTNGYASLTPVSDGTSLYSCNGLGIVTKHDLNGNRIWAKTMEKPDHGWGASASPQLVDGKLIIRFSDYTALDTETGEELWRVENPIVFGAPAAFELEGQWFLYSTRGELIRVADGAKLPSQDWSIEQKKFAFFNTNFVSGNRIYAAHGAAGIQGDVYCMEIPSSVSELEEKGLTQIWQSAVSKERYYASPLVHEGLVYIFSMGQVFQALDASTGEMIYSQKIPGRMNRTFPGLLLVDDMIYAGEEDGMAFFLRPGREYKEIARFNIGECRSSPIFAGDTAYLRTMEHVYAFRKSD